MRRVKKLMIEFEQASYEMQDLKKTLNELRDSL